MKRKRRATFSGGDHRATLGKAYGLLAVGRQELKALPYRDDLTSAQRARLRQAADKSWKALSAGADAYFCAVHGTPTKGNKQTLGVFKSLGSQAAGEAGSVFGFMHIACGYQDSPACSRATVEKGYRDAAQALRALDRRLAQLRHRGKARRSCPPWPST
jgi:hypothetical protein